MRERAYNLAIETSSRIGSVTLGRDDDVLATVVMPPQRRHRVDLMPTVDAICRAHGAAPGDLAEVYLSIGPGSFTGLRIAAATAKVLAQVLNVKLAAVPTLDVLARLAPPPAITDEALAVCLNLKHDSVHSGIYRHGESGWELADQPALRTIDQLLAHAPRPVAILGDPLPALPADVGPGVRVLDQAHAQPRSEAVWQLGREAAKAAQFDDPLTLLPMYVREPEAVTLWEQRQRRGA